MFLVLLDVFCLDRPIVHGLVLSMLSVVLCLLPFPLRFSKMSRWHFSHVGALNVFWTGSKKLM
jgi:hypothetical protein